MTRATQSSWKHLPAPLRKEPLEFEALFNDAEAERLMDGLVPGAMEDKWFIYYADGWLHFHRSWTGALIYNLRLDGSAAGVRVVDSWVNREPEQYQGVDTEYDRKLVRFLIDAFLLRKDAVFPMPPSSDGSVQGGVVQHAYVGRAYPESAPHEGDKECDA
ncbi:MAG: hypothetical protein WBP13_09355 [Methylophilaceae bacterium]